MITNSLGKKVKERYHNKDTSVVFVRIKPGITRYRSGKVGGTVAVMITNSIGKKVKERYHNKDTSVGFVRIKPGITHYHSGKASCFVCLFVLFVLVSFIF